MESSTSKSMELPMSSSLGQILANPFLVYYEKNRLENFPSDFNPHYYQRHVIDIFVLFISSEHLGAFPNFINGRHANM